MLSRLNAQIRWLRAGEGGCISYNARVSRSTTYGAGAYYAYGSYYSDDQMTLTWRGGQQGKANNTAAKIFPEIFDSGTPRCDGDGTYESKPGIVAAGTPIREYDGLEGFAMAWGDRRDGSG